MNKPFSLQNLIFKLLYVDGAIVTTPYLVKRCFYLISEVFDLKINYVYIPWARPSPLG